MLRPVEIGCDGGRIFIGPPFVVPSYPRSPMYPVSALNRLSRNRQAMAQLRQAWPRLGLAGGHHEALTAAEMREALRRAIVQHRINLLWAPPTLQAPMSIPVELQRKAAAPVAHPPAGHPPRPAVAVPVSRLSTLDKFGRAFDKATAYIVKDAKAESAALLRTLQHLTVTQTTLLIGSFALFLVPGAGEVMLAYVTFRLGFDGARAAIHLIHACYAVAVARSEGELDKAARELADGIEYLGETLLDWLMRGQLLKAVTPGARAAAGEARAGGGAAGAGSRTAQSTTAGTAAGARGGPGAWSSVNESMSSRAAAYQAQVTGRTGQSYIVNGVKFDGFENGVLLDAKGPGYATFVKNGEFRSFFSGQDALLSQAERQVVAANGVPITWHVAEAPAADAMRALLNANNVKGISIVHTPFGP